MEYRYISDSQEERGFINKDKILSYVTEEQIFSLVFGYEPEELEYVTSPFRDDETPSCYFERLGQNKLRFIDHSRKFYPDCFDAVRIYFGLPSFYHSLVFVYDKLIKGKTLQRVERQSTREREEDAPVVIRPQTRWFTNNDRKFWEPHGVTRQQLMDDNVFAVTHINLLNTRKGDVSYDVNELCYAYTGFESGRKKLYFPQRGKSDIRFISTCTANDIGCLDSLPPTGRQLVITKSYKDCRVIRNTGRYSIWFQSEGTIPDLAILFSIVKRFDSVVVLYDNDDTGKESAMVLANTINREFPRKARALWLPEDLGERGITDPGDMVLHESYQELISIFKNYMI